MKQTKLKVLLKYGIIGVVIKMLIDLSKLLKQNRYEVDEDCSLIENFQNTSIKALKNLHIKGIISHTLSDEITIDATLKGIMVLEDAYTLELVDYPFDIKIDATISNDEQKSLKITKNNENALDISSILWENIVLEVPISYSSHQKVLTDHGEGWQLVDENTKKIDPRLAKLAMLLEDDGKE